MQFNNHFSSRYLGFFIFSLSLFMSHYLKSEYSKIEYNVAAFLNPAEQISMAINMANIDDYKSVYDINSLVGKYLIEVPKYNGMTFIIDKDTKNLIVKVNSLSCSTINNSVNDNINKYGKNVNYGCKEINSYIGDEKFTEFVAFYNTKHL